MDNKSCRLFVCLFIAVSFISSALAFELKQAKQPGNSNYDAIIVGSGVGGLTIAALLAHKNYRVLVLEKEEVIGGLCRSWAQDGFCFNQSATQVTGLSPQGPLTYLLKKLGTAREELFIPLWQQYRIGDKVLNVHGQREELIDQLTNFFPEEREHLEQFFAEVDEAYQLCCDEYTEKFGVPLDLNQVAAIDGWWAALRFGYTHRSLASWLNQSLSIKLTKSFSNKDLVSFIENLAFTIGLNPHNTSALLGLYAVIVPLIYGSFYPKGGSAGLVNYLKKCIEKRGGIIRTQAPVDEIIVAKDSVSGVRVGGEVIIAPLIIANSDPQIVAALISPHRCPSSLRDQTKNLRWSPSALVVSFGIDEQLKNAPSIITLQEEKAHIAINSIDPTMAPIGCTSITVALSCPFEKVPQESFEKQQWTEKMTQKMWSLVKKELNLAASKPIVTTCVTPLDLAKQIGTATGAAYGGFLPDPQNQENHELHCQSRTPIKGLFMVGSSVLFGGGIEGVVMTAITCFHEVTGWQSE